MTASRPLAPPAAAPAARGAPRLLWLSAIVIAIGATPSLAADPPKLGFERGKLQEVAPSIRALAKLGVSGSRLELIRKHWNQGAEGRTDAEIIEAMVQSFMQNGMPRENAQHQAAQYYNRPRVEFLFVQLQNAAKYSTVSARSSPQDRSLSFGGRGLSASLEMRGDLVELSFEEEEAPFRKLELTDDGEGSFRLTLSNRSGELLLIASQAKSGRFSLAEVRGEVTRAESAKSFFEFYRGHRALIEHELFPLFEYLGVGVPPASDSPEIRQAVLARLSPLSARDRDRAETLLATLDSDAFDERENAEAALDAEFMRFRPIIVDAAADESASPEVVSRLKRLLSRRAAAELNEQVVDALRLTTDGPYLAGLHDAVSPEHRPLIVARLERITGQKLGADIAKWKAWLAKHPNAGEAAATTNKR